MKIGSKHFMDWWSYIYVIMILLISLFISDFNIVMFILYFVLALPFINSIEHFVVISLLLSTKIPSEPLNDTFSPLAYLISVITF